MDALAHPRTFERATETVQYIRSQLPEVLQQPKVGIICGSGLGGLADTIEAEPKVELSYSDIPHFPRSTGMSNTESKRNTWRGIDTEAQSLDMRARWSSAWQGPRSFPLPFWSAVHSEWNNCFAGEICIDWIYPVTMKVTPWTLRPSPRACAKSWALRL